MAPDVRLASIDRGLAEQISVASPATQRRIALTAVEYGLAEVHGQAGVVDAAAAALRAGRYGDASLRSQLREEAARANVASDMSAENGDHATGVALAARAGAAMAAYYALLEDPEKAALDAVYATASAVNSWPNFEAAIQAAIAGGAS